MTKDNEKKQHSMEEGKRVNFLANLGGLVVLAGLSYVEPALMLGALSEMERRLQQLSEMRKEELRQLGKDKLAARNAEKRAFSTWQRAMKTERFDFSTELMKKLIIKLGGKLPAFDKDIASELRRIIRSIDNAK